MTDELWLRSLEAHHPGLDASASGHFCGAAAVALARHDTPPTRCNVDALGEHAEHLLWWNLPADDTRRAHNSRQDATRDGAYAVGLVFTHHRLELVAVARAEDGSGADWYVAPPGRGLTETGQPDFDDPMLHRLEVKGRDHGSLTPAVVQAAGQLARAPSELPAMLSIVSFADDRVVIAHVEP